MQSLSSFMNTIRFNFLYIDKYSFGRTWTYPESAIPYNMLRYIIDGSAEFVVDGETVIVRKGQVSYIPEGCWLSCKALEDTFAFTVSVSPHPCSMRGPIFSGSTITFPW
mgnify:CR=1 FL=1